MVALPWQEQLHTRCVAQRLPRAGVTFARRDRCCRFLVDLNRSAFDAVDSRRTAHQIGAAQQDLAFARENDRGLPASENDLLVRRQYQTLAIEACIDRSADRNVERRAFLAQEPDTERATGVTALEKQHHLAPTGIL